MGKLRTHRYTEELTSGVGGGVRSVFEVQRSQPAGVSDCGRISLDHHRAEPVGLPQRALGAIHVPGPSRPHVHVGRPRNARLLGKTRFRGRPVQILSVYDREPVPAWFRLLVDAQNRVVDAHMIAPSHFMLQRYSDFNGPIVDPAHRRDSPPRHTGSSVRAVGVRSAPSSR